MSLAGHMGPLIIVFNAVSGHRDVGEVRDCITQQLASAGRAHELLMIDDPARLAEFSAAAVQRARRARGVVVAVGGDGTLSTVAAAVLGSGLPFGVIPQGTFNYFARNHGVPLETAAAVQALLDAEPRDVQVGQLNDRIFLVNASLGLYPRLLEDREAHKQEFGRSRFVAIRSGLQTLASEPRQLRLRIESEQGVRELRTPTLFVGNNALQLERVGIDAADAVARNRGCLAAIVVRPISSLAMLGLALRGALGTLGEADQVESFAFRHLVADPVGHRRIKVAIDGEILVLPTPLRFAAASEPLRLLAPPAEAA